MATKEVWDFECPQFVDFVEGLNNSIQEDVFFDCEDHQSPDDGSVIKASPAISGNNNLLTEEAEDRLLDKMTAALSIIENTPKVKKIAMKGKLLSEKFSKDLCSKMAKSALKPNTALVPHARLHRSKSIARLNKIITEPAKNRKEYGLRKRSSSLNDLRTYKKQKYPMTPMCLKRTIIKAKTKVIKTTEEMELEEIAKLQKQLIQHLRNNEMTLKKLKLKARPCAIPKTQAKPENAKENKGLNTLIEKLNVTEKESRRNIQALNHVAMKNEAMKIDNIINREEVSSKSTDDRVNTRKSKKPLVPSVSSEVNEKSGTQISRKTANGKKLGFHSGLMFHTNVKKNTTVKPFSFDSKIKEIKVQNAGAEQKAEISGFKVDEGKENIPYIRLQSTVKKTKGIQNISGFKVDEGKENIPYIRLQSTVKKTKGIQNTKCDKLINKLLESNKKVTEKRVANSFRGLPLSENIARN